MNMKLEELKRKCAVMQAAMEICEESGGHLWGEMYWSKIGHDWPFRGDSTTCVRCGKRVARSEACNEGRFYR